MCEFVIYETQFACSLKFAGLHITSLQFTGLLNTKCFISIVFFLSRSQQLEVVTPSTRQLVLMTVQMRVALQVERVW